MSPSVWNHDTRQPTPVHTPHKIDSLGHLILIAHSAHFWQFACLSLIKNPNYTPPPSVRPAAHLASVLDTHDAPLARPVRVGALVPVPRLVDVHAGVARAVVRAAALEEVFGARERQDDEVADGGAVGDAARACVDGEGGRSVGLGDGGRKGRGGEGEDGQEAHNDRGSREQRL